MFKGGILGKWLDDKLYDLINGLIHWCNHNLIAVLGGGVWEAEVSHWGVTLKGISCSCASPPFPAHYKTSITPLPHPSIMTFLHHHSPKSNVVNCGLKSLKTGEQSKLFLLWIDFLGYFVTAMESELTQQIKFSSTWLAGEEPQPAHLYRNSELLVP
jgi:hypothetical protein